MHKTVIALGVAGAMIAGIVAAHAQYPTAARATAVDPANFTNPVANDYYPLVAGRIATLRGTEDGAKLLERVTTTHDTKMIQGVRTVVVFDVLFKDGLLHEKTTDWYANDNSGNVWYFGEDTAVYDKQGHVVSTAGTWQAGVDGAVAGLIMPADPKPTDAYRQEFHAGDAEDQAWIVQRHLTATTAYGRLSDLLRSFEWTRVEPHVMDSKLYAPGLGIVVEGSIVGGTEHLELVKVTG